MPEVFVVFDTHVFLGAITHCNPNYERAYDAMIERNNDKLLISERVKKQYESIIHKYGQKTTFLLLVALRNLEGVNKVKNVSKSSINSVNIKGLQTNDRPFVELACNRAKFLVTNDPHFHKGQRPREFRDKCRFAVKYAEDYVNR